MKKCVNSSQSLQSFLFKALEEKFSKKAIKRALEANACRVNGKVERFASRSLRKGDLVEFQAPLEKEALAFPILLETSDFFCVNKPAYWTSSQENVAKQFGKGCHLVHRLDKQTTGALLIAKSLSTKEAFISLFREGGVRKTYLAIVDGIFSKKQGTKRSYLSKKGSFQGQTIWGSALNGLEAITHWSVLQEGTQSCLVECEIPTGRTHQIRVHLAEMGHPILTDPQYARKYRSSYVAPRVLLHAKELHFSLENQAFHIKSPLPKDFLQAKKVLLSR